MAENPGRFVIIDGVQVSKERAAREGLIDSDGRVVKSKRGVADAGNGDGSPAGEHETRARGSKSAKTKAADAAPAGDAGDPAQAE